ncbi:MAG: TIGR02281 family clan AA aspartic protease [Pseudomonadota bacterium]
MIELDADAQMRVFYLSVLGLALLVGLFAQYRGRLGKAMQDAAIWGLIFMGAALVYAFSDELERALLPHQAQRVDARNVVLTRAEDGHFYTVLEVNDAPIRFMVDTGATNLVLSPRAAREAGFALDRLAYTQRAMTANGVVTGAPVTLGRVELAGMVDQDVAAVVNGGDLGISLLGMSYLDRFRSFQVEGDTMLLTR